MDDGGRVPQSGLSVDAGVPYVVAAELAGGGAGLLVIALFAYLRASLPRLLRTAVWVLRGREHLERKLVAAGVAPGLSLSPRLTGLLERASAQGRPVYLASRGCSPLLQALAERHTAIAGTIVVPDGVGSRRGSAHMLDCFPQGYDAVASRRGAITVVRHGPPGALRAGLAPEPSEPARRASRLSLRNT